MDNKSKICFFLFLIVPGMLCSQTWQWGKRGGSVDDVTTFRDKEQVKSMTCDAQGNVYVLSSIGVGNATIDGHPKTTYSGYGGNGGSLIDFAISKFDCTGNYQWSRVIGGVYSDQMQRIQTDNLGNVYGIGRADRDHPTRFVHFGQELPQSYDTILPYSQAQNVYKRAMFMVKYNQQGEMQWLRQPHAENVDWVTALTSYSLDFSLDPAGNSYWLCWLQPGSYGDGTLVNASADRKLYVLKYDAGGVFLGGFPFSMDPIGVSSLEFKFVRNHATGHFYVAGHMDPSRESTSFGSVTATKSMYLASFNADGTFRWMRESSSDSYLGMGFNDIKLDESGNIYIAGGTEPSDTFNGHIFTSTTPHQLPFLMKLDPEGNTLWITSGYGNAINFAEGISFNRNEVAVTGGFAAQLNWSGSIISTAINEGYDVFLARFNTATGSLNGLDRLTSNFGYDDHGTATAADPFGNFYVGGKFQGRLNVGATTLVNPGGVDTDFFVAKFGTTNCSMPLSVADHTFQNLKAYPNPSSGILHIEGATLASSYKIYNILGSEMASGTIAEGHQAIHIEDLPKGIYLLQIVATDRSMQTIKISKE